MREPSRSIVIRRCVVLTCVALVSLLPACASGGGDWLDSYPDVAARARQSPGPFAAAAGRQWEAVDSLTSSYGLRVSRGIGRQSFDVSIVVQRPDRLDISFLDPTGAIEAFLIHGPGEIGLYFAEDRVLYRAASRPGAFERALGLDLAPDDVVAAIIGYAMVGGTSGSDSPAVEWDEEAARIRVRSARAVGWLHPVSLLWDRVEYFGVLDEPGAGAAAGAAPEPPVPEGGVAAPAVVAAFAHWTLLPSPRDDFDEATRLVEPSEGVRPGEQAPDTVPVPSRIRLDVADGSYGITLELRGEPRLNPEIPADYFRIPALPAHVLTVPLSDLEEQGGLFRRATEEADGSG